MNQYLELWSNNFATTILFDMKALIAIAWLALVAETAVRASTAEDLQDATLTFPESCVWEFRPDVAVRCANALIIAGKEVACSALTAAALRNSTMQHDQDPEQQSEFWELNQKLCLLCRLLFRPSSPSDYLRRPRLVFGQPDFSMRRMDSSAWPDMPFAIVHGVPLPAH